MKKIALLSAVVLFCSHFAQAQKAHLALIHDFDGANFDYSVVGMVGANDSLYVVTLTPDNQGMFFRIDGNGEGYKVIWRFGEDRYLPNSIVAGEDAIYITTRIGNGGSLFKYSLKDYSFKRIRDFASTSVAEVNIKYVTDSVLWCTSLWSSEDEGSVFSMNPDGTNIKKLYSAKNPAETAMPANFFFHENKVYIAFWGGGNVDASNTYCGSFVRLNIDGSGYEKIIAGSDEIGTQPQSLVIRDNKLIGLFAYSGVSWAGRVFRSNLDGTEYEPLGSVVHRSLTKFLSTQSLIYGVTSFAIYGINPHNGKIRMYDDFRSNPDFGWDVVSDPVYLNGDVFITAQQGGPNEGGTILKWLNARPEVYVPGQANGRTATTENQVDLNSLFIDPNEDPLTFSYEYDPAKVTLTESNGILTFTPLTSDIVEVNITATDGWAGYATAKIQLNPFEISAEETEIKIPQSIEFDPIVTKTYGDAAFTLSATASSELPVTFTSSDNSIVSINGNTASILNAGTVIITASQNGDDTHAAAPPVNHELIINKANQDINFDEIPVKQQDSDDFDLVASASSGLPVSFTTSNAEVAIVSGSTVSIIAHGTALITAAQSGNGNYNAATAVARVLTVDLVTGTDPDLDAEINVFPNPTHDRIHITGNVKEFVLVDTFGRIVNERTIDRNRNTLNVGSLAGGIYMLKITGQSTTRVVRIVKK